MKEQEWDTMIEEIIDISKTNPKKASELYKIAYGKVQTWDHLAHIASGVTTRLNDKEFGKTLCNEAVEKAETALQYCIIAETISHPDGLNDKVWAKKVFQIALEKSKSDNMTASIKDSMYECLEEDWD